MADSSRVVFSSFRAGGDPMLQSWSRFREAVAPASLGDRSAASRPVPAQTRVMGARAGTGGAMGTGGVVASVSSGSADRTGVWRILATNNRELCRSAHVYPTFSGARAHVALLRDRIDELVVTPVVGNRPGSRGWYMTLNGVVVVTCGRWYGAAASSAEAASASLEALATAVIMEEARAVTTPGRRASRGAIAAAGEAVAW